MIFFFFLISQQKRENILLSNATNGKFQTPPLTPPIPALPTQPSIVVPIEVSNVGAENKEETTSFNDENGDESPGKNLVRKKITMNRMLQ